MRLHPQRAVTHYGIAPEEPHGPATMSTLNPPNPLNPPTLQSFLAGRWQGAAPAQLLKSAINGRPVAATHAETPDFAEALHHARTVGLLALLKLDFQQRAATLKALAKYLGEHKEQLYAWSAHTGATRSDGWVDIEGGSGTLLAYAGFGSNELPSGNLVHEGPVLQLSKKGGFAGTHILVPRRGVALHINAFSFPVWGLLEKFAPSFLAGMPCIAKPATATSYLTEACVRLMLQSGLLPEGALQLVIGSTGDLLGRLEESDVVTFTGSADTALQLRTHPNIVRRSVPFNAEADSLNCAILGPDAVPGSEEFDLLRQGSGARDDGESRSEVHRHPPRHRAAPASASRGRCPEAAPGWRGGGRPGRGRREYGRARFTRAAVRRG